MNPWKAIRTALFVCVAIGIVSSAWAAEDAPIENTPTGLDDCWVVGSDRCYLRVKPMSLEPGNIRHAHLSGPIGDGYAWQVAASWMELSFHKHIVLTLDSTGGNVEVALALQKAMLLHGDVETVVRDGKSCYSACTIVWLAGRKRILERFASLMFHGMSCERTCNKTQLKHILELERKFMLTVRDREPALARLLVSRHAFSLHNNDGIKFQRDGAGLWFPSRWIMLF